MGGLPIEAQLPIRTILLNEIGQLGVTLSQREGGIPGFPRFHLVGLGLPGLGALSIHLRIPDCQASRRLPRYLCYEVGGQFRPTGDYLIISAPSISSVWNHTMDPDELRERAYRYRKMALGITDARAVKALNDLADEYEARAAQPDPLRGGKRGRWMRACCRSDE